MEQWTDFFVAEVGAAAALAGLLVVAVSINIEKIMSFATLPSRAAQTLIIIGGALVTASLGLLPSQPLPIFGVEALAISAVTASSGIIQVRAATARRQPADPLVWTLVPLVIVAVSALPQALGGVLLVAGNESGLYWVAVAIIASFVATLISGWVLLIEILR